MLRTIQLQDVGPAPTLDIAFNERLNLLTGDNGVGKTFMLDIAWWALTRSWAGRAALPHRGESASPSISYEVDGRTKRLERTGTYDWNTQSWQVSGPGRPPKTGLVVYVRAEGGLSVWDPARNYYRDADSIDVKESDRPAAYNFQTRELWNGLEYDGKIACEGLLRDWIRWQDRDSEEFDILIDVLEELSPPGQEKIRPGEPTRIDVEDVRDIPTLDLPYGEIPVTHASAGMRRILAIAYSLVWAWTEHRVASDMMQREPAEQIVVLFDEVEAHLHPKWQRSIIPALLSAVKVLERSLDVQVISATHSPLVMASVEPEFDQSTDDVFHLELEKNQVTIDRVPWAKQGDVTGWLVSEIFGLDQARSQEAERAIEAAEAFMRDDTDQLPADLDSEDAIDRELRRVLPDHDPFWPRWITQTKRAS